MAKPHVVVLSSPGLGHQIPVLELSKHLVRHHNFEVTIFVVVSQSSPVEKQLIESAMSPKLCEIVELPHVDISKVVDSGAAVVTLLRVMMRETKPSLQSAILGLNFRPAALIVDLFGTESLVIARELGIPGYVYIGCNAWFLALTLYAPTLDKEVEGQYVDRKEMLKIPGCKPVRPEDVVDPMLDRADQQYLEYLKMGAEMPTSDGILINVWEDLQPTTLATFRDEKLLGRVIKVPVFPIGPLTRPVGQPGSEGELFAWLSQQPNDTVVYVSFGSGGTLSFEQTMELAWGIELSQQRFIWVVRPPTITSGDGSYFTAGKGEDAISSYLPDGFLSRTKERGLVVSQWAPQIDILSHPSVGGFLSHCGWNSTLESITNGVPMIAWPLYAEQRLNATLLAEELGVAVRPKILPSKEVVRREEVESMIRMIMVDKEGEKIRQKVKELKCRAEKALSKGGSSHKALSTVSEEIETSWKFKNLTVEP